MLEITYPRKWRWPDGQKMAMSVGLAFEAFERHSQFSTLTSAAGRTRSTTSRSPTRITAGRPACGACSNCSTAMASRPTCRPAASPPSGIPTWWRRSHKAGHELNGHGWVNDHIASDDDEEAEREEIRRCTQGDHAGRRRTPGRLDRPRHRPARRIRSRSSRPRATSGTATTRATICRSCATPSTARW